MITVMSLVHRRIECLERMTWKRSRKEMADQIKNIIGKRNISIILSILNLGPFRFPRHYSSLSSLVELILSRTCSSLQSLLERLYKGQFWCIRWQRSKRRWSRGWYFWGFFGFISSMFVSFIFASLPSIMLIRFMKYLHSLRFRRRKLVLFTPILLLAIFFNHVEFGLIINFVEPPVVKLEFLTWRRSWIFGRRFSQAFDLGKFLLEFQNLSREGNDLSMFADFSFPITRCNKINLVTASIIHER